MLLNVGTIGIQTLFSGSSDVFCTLFANLQMDAAIQKTKLLKASGGRRALIR